MVPLPETIKLLIMASMTTYILVAESIHNTQDRIFNRAFILLLVLHRLSTCMRGDHAKKYDTVNILEGQVWTNCISTD